MRKEIRTNFLSTKIAKIVRKSLVSDELSMMGAYSDNSIKNTVLRPNRHYKASTAEMA
jgi:hypothetical protein